MEKIINYLCVYFPTRQAKRFRNLPFCVTTALERRKEVRGANGGDDPCWISLGLRLTMHFLPLISFSHERERAIAYQNFRPLCSIELYFFKVLFFKLSIFDSISIIFCKDTKSLDFVSLHPAFVVDVCYWKYRHISTRLMCGHIVSDPYFACKNYDVILVTWEQLKGAVANRNMWFVLVF